MRVSFPVSGPLAVILLLIYIASVTPLLPQTQTISSICPLVGCSSLVMSIVAVRSSGRYDRVCGKAVLAVLLILLFISLFVPAISR